MPQPFAPRKTLRSSLRTSRRSSRIWLALPLLFVTACGGSTIADSTWGSTGLPDRVLPAPPWYTAWATEQAKLNPDPVQMTVAKATRLIWEARCGRSVDALKTDYDEATFAQAGQMTIDSIGYDEILSRAKQVGWVKIVRKTQRKAPAAKGLIAQSETEVVVVMFEVFTEYAVTAGVVSQLDSPLPGPGDLAAIGLMAVCLYKVGAIALDALTTATAPAPTSPPPPPPRKYPNQTCEEVERIRLNDEMHKVCDGGFAATCGGRKIAEKKLKKIPCSVIKLSLLQRRACMAARWLVQNKCFGGKPDPEHKDKIDQTQDGIDHCEALELKNCAKGHPMAGN